METSEKSIGFVGNLKAFIEEPIKALNELSPDKIKSQLKQFKQDFSYNFAVKGNENSLPALIKKAIIEFNRGEKEQGLKYLEEAKQRIFQMTPEAHYSGEYKPIGEEFRNEFIMLENPDSEKFVKL